MFFIPLFELNTYVENEKILIDKTNKIMNFIDTHSIYYEIFLLFFLN